MQNDDVFAAISGYIVNRNCAWNVCRRMGNFWIERRLVVLKEQANLGGWSIHAISDYRIKQGIAVDVADSKNGDIGTCPDVVVRVQVECAVRILSKDFQVR